MKCNCEATRHRFWGELVDSVTMRHGYNRITWQQMHDSLTPEEHVMVGLLADLEGTTRRDVYDILAGHLVLETPAQEIERVFEEEIMPLETLMQPLRPELQGTGK